MKKLLMLASLMIVTAFAVMGTVGAGVASAGNCNFSNSAPGGPADVITGQLNAFNCTGVSGLRVTLEHWWNDVGNNYTSTQLQQETAPTGTYSSFNVDPWTYCYVWMAPGSYYVADTFDYSIRSWPGQTWGPTHTSNQGGGVPEFCPQ